MDGRVDHPKLVLRQMCCDLQVVVDKRLSCVCSYVYLYVAYVHLNTKYLIPKHSWQCHTKYTTDCMQSVFYVDVGAVLLFASFLH